MIAVDKRLDCRHIVYCQANGFEGVLFFSRHHNLIVVSELHPEVGTSSSPFA